MHLSETAIFMSLALVLLLAGCGGISAASTPEEAARNAVVHPNSSMTMQGFQVFGVRSWAAQAIVVYGVYEGRFGQPLAYTFGHVITEHAGNGWIDQTGSSGSANATFQPKWQVCYAVAIGNGKQGDYAIAFGRVPANVAAVEVEFADGDKLSDIPTGDVFAVVDPHATEPSILRTVDAAGQTLYQVGLPTMQPFSSGTASSAGLTCSP